MRTPSARLLLSALLAVLAHAPAAAMAEPPQPARVRLAAAGCGSAGCGSEAAELPAPAARCERGDCRVALLSPRPAIPLAAGSTAVLQWAPLPGLAGLPARQEWEAFLSLDGGKSYTYRITPHLDSDLRRTLWEVPGVASADVRLLLRFGDERRETAIELPQRFTITAAPGPVLALGSRWSPARRRGEAARPEDDGVVAWTEGTRRGTGRRQVVLAAMSLRAGVRQSQPANELAALTVRPGKGSAPAPARESAASPPRGSAAPQIPARQTPPPPIDARLQTSRLNE